MAHTMLLFTICITIWVFNMRIWIFRSLHLSALWNADDNFTCTRHNTTFDACPMLNWILLTYTLANSKFISSVHQYTLDFSQLKHRQLCPDYIKLMKRCNHHAGSIRFTPAANTKPPQIFVGENIAIHTFVSTLPVYWTGKQKYFACPKNRHSIGSAANVCKITKAKPNTVSTRLNLRWLGKVWQTCRPIIRPYFLPTQQLVEALLHYIELLISNPLKNYKRIHQTCNLQNFMVLGWT